MLYSVPFAEDCGALSSRKDADTDHEGKIAAPIANQHHMTIHRQTGTEA